jgi:hypothetical protein
MLPCTNGSSKIFYSLPSESAVTYKLSMNSPIAAAVYVMNTWRGARIYGLMMRPVFCMRHALVRLREVNGIKGKLSRINSLIQ